MALPWMKSLRVRMFEKGTELIRKGDSAEELYFLVNGKLSIEGAERKILKEQSFFGEIALLGEFPRSATVRAETDVVVLVISKSDFLALVKEKNDFADMIFNVARNRVLGDGQLSPSILRALDSAKEKFRNVQDFEDKYGILERCSRPNNPVRIVATIGPSTFDSIEKVLPSGGFVRFNLAFVHHDEDVVFRKEIMKRIRCASPCQLGILLDVVGPRVKLGKLPKDGIELVEGASFCISVHDREFPVGSAAGCATVFSPLCKFVKNGHRILLAEGRFELRVVEIDLSAGHVKTVVVRGGLLKKRGINCPDSDLGVPALSEDDMKWLRAFLVDDPISVDMIALSFVRSVGDVEDLRTFLKSLGREDVRIMSKIETQQAVDNINDIASVSDALMIARGDLWAEIQNPWSLPRLTLSIIRAGQSKGIPVITATQVASSMQYNSIPTRAEVDELYFLLENGSDVVMGSEEFSSGQFPVETADAFARVAEQVELDRAERLSKANAFPDFVLSLDRSSHEDVPISFANPEWCRSTFHQRLTAIRWAESSPRVHCLVVFSASGATARAVYRERPTKPLLVITNRADTARYLQLMLVSVVLGTGISLENLVDHREIALKALAVIGWADEGLGVSASAIVLTNETAFEGGVLKIEEVPFSRNVD